VHHPYHTIPYHKVQVLQYSQRSEKEVILVDVAADAVHEGPDAPAVYQNVALNHGPGCSADPNANGTGRR